MPELLDANRRKLLGVERTSRVELQGMIEWEKPSHLFLRASASPRLCGKIRIKFKPRRPAAENRHRDPALMLYFRF